MIKVGTVVAGLVSVVLGAFAAGGCSSASGSNLAADSGTPSGFGDGGSGSGGGGGGGDGSASLAYCFFEYQGAQRCVGFGGLAASQCAVEHGTLVPSCPTAGMVGCCSNPPDYEQCWYCPSDPSQLQTACGPPRGRRGRRRAGTPAVPREGARAEARAEARAATSASTAGCPRRTTRPAPRRR